MALINKLSAIGDAIREKTGKEELLTLEDMVREIAGIETGVVSGISPTISIETVIATESGTAGDVVMNYVKTLFPTLDVVEPCLFKVLIVKDIEAAKQTNNGFCGIFASYYAAATPAVAGSMLRWRNGAWSTASSGPGFDVNLASGTEFYMVTIDMKGMWA